MINELNARQRLFIAKYLESGNATQAAIAAGYSAKSAKTVGPRMLENVGVRAAIDESLARVNEKAELKAADVLAELRQVAFARLTNAFAPDGSLLPLNEMPEDMRAALASLETDEIFKGRGDKRVKIGETKRIKLADKLKALELLGKHFKLFTDVQEVTGKDSDPVQVVFMVPSEARERVNEGKDPSTQYKC